MSKIKDPSALRPDTRLTTVGRDPERQSGVVNTPVYRASTVTFPTVAAFDAARHAPFDSVYYGRYGTPTTFALEDAVSELEAAHRSVAVCSGVAAIAAAVLAFVKAGDHVLMVDTAYFPTRRLCDVVLKRFGVETTYYDPMIGEGIAGLIQPNTRVLFMESPGSLTFEVQDVPAMIKAAKARGVRTLIDNTWSAGYYFKPISHGMDVSIQSVTKYLVGHSDVMLGAIACADRAIFEQVKQSAVELGYAAAPDDCYLALRGIRSLAARLERHQETGLKVAKWMAARPEVDRVLHPALPSCPGHAVWQRDFSGATSLFGVVLKGHSKKAVAAMLDGLSLFAMGASWGGYESLIQPTEPGHLRTATRWPHPEPGLRLHCGLEDADDLIADLAAGFERLNAA